MPHRALHGLMVADKRTNLVDGQYHQQPPQLALRRDFIRPSACAVEKRAEDGLDNIVGVKSTGEMWCAILTREGTQARSIFQVDPGCGVVIARLVTVEQGCVAPRVTVHLCRRR